MICPYEAWTTRCAGLAGPDPDGLQAWQLGQLAETVARVQAHSRFYRERLQGFDGSLESLPFTTPADLAREPLDFLCVPQSGIARVTTVTTSGSMGDRKRIFFTEGDLERIVAFFSMGMTMLVKEGQDTLILMGADTEHSIARLLQAAVARLGARGRIGSMEWGAEETLAAARTADCIVGLPSELLYLCRLDGSLRPSTVLLSADYVPAPAVATLRERWDCQVFTHFGMTETGFGYAVQCDAGEGHHARHPEVILEIVDPGTGRPVPPGERGEIVLTMFRHEAMPLLRYRTGDLSRLVAGPCPCGGVYPRLGPVEGRRESELVPGLSIHRLDELLFAHPGVLGFSAALDQEGGRPVLLLTVESRT
ncbi:MAG TPA: AMP-binding protein, partial [Holophaga sp.]|nr:AMP-binding protein [Holophaga sp.]